MQITKSQMIAVGLLGVAVVALVVDRVTSGGPPAHPSPVGPVFSVGSLLPETPDKTAAPVAFTMVGDDVAARLSRLSRENAAAVRDAFKPSSQWMAEVSAVPAQATQSQLQFVAKHQLKAVIEAGAGSVVQVNGSLVRMGQNVDGFRLGAVHRLSADFVDGSQKVTLRLLQDTSALSSLNQSE